MSWRWRTVVRVILVCVTVLGFSRAAAENKAGNCGSLRWTLANGTLTISGSGSMPDYSAEEPAPWHEYADGITAVNIGSGVQHIGAYAFAGCGMSEIYVPSGVESIGRGAFRDTHPVSLSLPFVGGAAQTSNVPEMLFGYIFDYTNTQTEGTTKQLSYYYYIPGSIRSVTIRDATKIPNFAFQNCGGIMEIQLPAGVKTIGYQAFAYTGITHLEVPGTVTLMDSRMLEGTPLVSLTVPFIGTGRANPDSGSETVLGTLFGWTTCSRSDVIPDETAVYQYYEKNGSSYNYYWFYIPETLRTLTVTGTKAIPDYAVRNCSMITELNIAGGVTAVGKYAFSGCSGLTELVLGNSVTTMGERALEKCGGLGTFHVPAGVKTLANGLFRDCAGLTAVILPDELTTMGDGVFTGCTALEEIILPPGMTTIPQNSFAGCTGLAEVTLREGITTIGSGAFSGCSGLEAVHLPASLRTIESEAFRDCTTLASITVPDGVTGIGEGAFRGTGMVNITLPFVGESRDAQGWKKPLGYIFGCEYRTDDVKVDGAVLQYSLNSESQTITGQSSWSSFWYFVPETLRTVTVTDAETIPDHAFAYLSWLTEVHMNEGITSIGDIAFPKCSGLTELEIPSTVTSIGRDVFRFCSGLRELELPEELTTIGNGAMMHCTGLTRITIPAKVVSIGNNAFDSCSNLAEIELPAGLKSIGESAFYATALAEVDLPDGLETIGDMAFRGCTELTEITVPDSVQSIGEAAFEGTGLVTLRVPFAGKSRGAISYEATAGYVFGYEKMAFTVVNDEVIYSRRNGVEGATLQYVFNSYSYWYYIPETLRTIEITDATRLDDCAMTNLEKVTRILLNEGIGSIGDYAFYGCDALEGLTVPRSVKQIGEYAFYKGTWLTEVEIDSLDALGRMSFAYCSGLRRFIARGGTITETGHGCFAHCPNLEEAELPDSLETMGSMCFYYCTALTGFRMPENLTDIGENAFNHSGLTEAEFGGGVRTIATGAFTDCTGLTRVRMNDGLETILEEAFRGCTHLATLTVPNSVQRIGEGAFRNCGLVRISLPFAGESRTATEWGGVLGYIFGFEVVKNDQTPPDDAVLQWLVYTESAAYTGQGTWTEAWYYIPGTLRSVQITDATAIRKGAFSNLPQMTSVTINEGVTEIGERAFWKCSGLSRICIPGSVRTIGKGAFDYCSGLREVFFPGSAEEWDGIEIGENNEPLTGAARYYGRAGETVTLTLPGGVETIESEAFAGLGGRHRIVMTEAVKAIAPDAFAGSDMVIVAPEGSYAEEWAEEHGMPFETGE